METTKEIFKSKGIKATAQRLIVYKSLESLGHATVDEVVVLAKAVIPTISVSTVYNILEALTDAAIISRLHTEDTKMYYDINIQQHHHLYSREQETKIMDYQDNELTKLILDYLAQKQFENFMLEDIKLHLMGKFKK